MSARHGERASRNSAGRRPRITVPGSVAAVPVVCGAMRPDGSPLAEGAVEQDAGPDHRQRTEPQSQQPRPPTVVTCIASLPRSAATVVPGTFAATGQTAKASSTRPMPSRAAQFLGLRQRHVAVPARAISAALLFPLSLVQLYRSIQCTLDARALAQSRHRVRQRQPCKDTTPSDRWPCVFVCQPVALGQATPRVGGSRRRWRGHHGTVLPMRSRYSRPGLSRLPMTTLTMSGMVSSTL